MEGGKPTLALDTWFIEMKLKPADKALLREEIERGWSWAIQCDRRSELTPWLLRYLGGMREAKLDLGGLREASKSGSEGVAEYQRWLRGGRAARGLEFVV